MIAQQPSHFLAAIMPVSRGQMRGRRHKIAPARAHSAMGVDRLVP
jgi:hypothetical protein